VELFDWTRIVKMSFMPFPIKVCVVCGEEFELRPDKPGFANRCPECSSPDAEDLGAQGSAVKTDREGNAARRQAMKELLYRKDS
jgi:hypothetical protein